MDDRLGTADARLHDDRFLRAVAQAGAAFHARIPVGYPGKTIFYCHYAVWTDHGTHTAARAPVFKEAKCGHTGKIFHADPPEVKNALIQRAMATTEKPICAGTAYLISFLTPEREV